MSIALASTWHPRGENARLERLWSMLEGEYASMVFCLHPDTRPSTTDHLSRGHGEHAHFYIMENWTWGRYEALRLTAQTGSPYLHYADLDRLLRWVETCPEEWRHTLQLIQAVDCLVIGRTPTAYRTHPQALIQTEQISNRVISNLIGLNLDISAGAKGFSLPAANFILANSAPGHAMGTDAEWPILCQRGGFKVESCLVDGLDWESADRFQKQAADRQAQAQAAGEYDLDPQQWSLRVGVAEEIIMAGLDAYQRPLRQAAP